MDWKLDLLTPPGTTSNYSATANFRNSQFNTAFANLFQPAVPSPAVPWQRFLTVEILQLSFIDSRSDLTTSYFVAISSRVSSTADSQPTRCHVF
jgi:hypothetical protein